MLFSIIVHYSIERRKERDTHDIQNQDRNNGSTATKTKIMYQAFLSYPQMKKHLMVLTQNGLLSYNVDTQTFKTTEKGLRFLDTFNQMSDMIKEKEQLQQQVWVQREEVT
jgi:predicted transcriptional regulator